MSLALPRNTTRQSESMLLGDAARVLHRLSGTVIVVFVLVHVAAQAVLRAPALAGWNAAMPWLPVVQNQPWIHAVLYFSIVFHALYGLRLLATELGARIDYRRSLWIIVALAALAAVKELARYVA
ncbi:MAG: hypothetical protein IT531_17760 [Burkholderiales bacterium]|nr:hypothetical protein [Burkholderiales bacterium]